MLRLDTYRKVIYKGNRNLDGSRFLVRRGLELKDKND
jgi:hypothetical protein